MLPFYRFTQFTMLPQALLRTLLLGAMRKLSPLDQRFHRKFLLTAISFELGTFLCSNLVD